MAVTLVPGEIIHERFEIKRTLSSSDVGGVYLAFDRTITAKNWVLKEIVPDNLSNAELLERTEKFQRCADIIVHFDNVNLARIIDFFSEARKLYVVMEYTDGVTLQAILDMSGTPLPEKQVLEWALEICDGLHYLHNRPQAFVFDVLDPSHVMVTQEGRVKLINYGLDQYFRAGATEKEYDKTGKSTGFDFRSLAATIFHLITKKAYREDEPFPEDLPASPALKAFLRRFLTQDPHQAHTTALEVKKQIQNILTPEAVPDYTKRKKGPRRKWVPDISLSLDRVMDWFFYVFLQQKKAFLLGEALLVLAIAGIWIYSLFPHYSYLKKGPVAYVICNQREFWTLDFATRKVLDKRILDVSISSVLAAPSRGVIYLTGYDSSAVLVTDIRTNEILYRIPVDKTPGKMLLSPDSSRLYVLNSSTNNVSVVATASKKLKSILPVGNNPTDMVLSANGGTLYVANNTDSSVTVLDTRRDKCLGNILIPGGAAGLELSRDESTLFVSLREWNNLQSVLLPSLKSDYIYPDIGAEMPSDITLSPDGRNLFVLGSRNSRVGIVNISSRKLMGVVNVGRLPMNFLKVPKGEKSFDLWVANKASNSISHIDASSGRLFMTINVGRNPTALGFAK
jgi:DNA-binding beta-propeller fold protein YncE